MNPQNDRTRLARATFIPVEIILALLALTAVAASIYLAAAVPPARAALRSSAAASHAAVASLFVSDKGKFRILSGGKEVGSEEYEIAPSGENWIARGSSEIKSAQGPSQHVTGTLELRPDGTPIRYQWTTQGAKKASAAISFEGVIATIELQLEGAKPYTQQFTFNTPLVVVLDNNLYDQYAVLARLYDWKKMGPQSFSVLVPQDLAPGVITVESLGKQDVSGQKLDELRVKTDDNEIDLFLDGARLVRISAPAANAEIIRE
jgi:hypothetical protein